MALNRLRFVGEGALIRIPERSPDRGIQPAEFRRDRGSVPGLHGLQEPDQQRTEPAAHLGGVAPKSRISLAASWRQSSQDRYGTTSRGLPRPSVTTCRRRSAAVSRILRAWAHTLGYRGRILAKSRAYSTTYAALRADRAEHRGHEAVPGTVTDAHRRYVGSGHIPGAALIAEGIAEDLASNREFARQAVSIFRVVTERVTALR